MAKAGQEKSKGNRRTRCRKETATLMEGESANLREDKEIKEAEAKAAKEEAHHLAMDT